MAGAYSVEDVLPRMARMPGEATGAGKTCAAELLIAAGADEASSSSLASTSRAARPSKENPATARLATRYRWCRTTSRAVYRFGWAECSW